MRTATVILAAGKGTRMKSDLPKVVFKLSGKAMINRVIETANQINSEKIIVVVGYKREQVKAEIGNQANIEYAVQEPQMGTGHAVMVCREALKDFEGIVFILYGDVPMLKVHTLQQMQEVHLKEQAACTVLTAVISDAAQYGRIVRNEAGEFLRIVEFKDASPKEHKIKEINTGIYCFNSGSLRESLEELTNDNKQKEYYLTDTLEILRKKGNHIASVILDDFTEATGVNSLEQLEELEKHFINEVEN